MLKKKFAALGILALAPAFAACAGLLGIEDGVLDTAPAKDNADASAGDAPIVPPDTTGMPADAHVDALPDVIGADVGDMCALEQPDPHGVFVAPTGSAAASCGSKAAPCSTIQLGVDQAKALAAANVYVAPGTYAETVTLAAAVAVHGGWNAGTWQRQCVPTRGASVIVTGSAASGIGVKADALNGVASLDTLTIAAGLGVAPRAGQSFYGIVATGASTRLDIRDVTIQAAAGGPGAPGKAGAAGASGSHCTNTNGAAGSGGASGAGAPPGTFGAAGYVTPSGAAGGPGASGGGTGPGANSYAQCASNCSGLYPTCDFSRGAVFGWDGTGGCGGAGGGPGEGGQGGGSSIALLAWGAEVNLSGGGLEPGNGGNGGSGGAGGTAGTGTPGTPGDVRFCKTSCTPDTQLRLCMYTDQVQIPGGQGGPPGGVGGIGGEGGGGAGGDSYAVYAGNMAKVSPGDAYLSHGAAGVAAGNGAQGSAAKLAP